MRILNLMKLFLIYWIVNRLLYFNIFFAMEIITIREETLRYTGSKSNHSFDITEKSIMKFLGTLIISGYHTMPSKKQYWSTRPSFVAPIYLETMSRSRFLEIKKYLHLANNGNPSDIKTVKVDLLYCKLLLNC